MAIQGLETILRDHPMFRDFPEDFLATIAGCAKNMVFRPGQYLFHEGEAEDLTFLIREGIVSLEMVSPGLGPQSFLTERAGGVIGLSGLVPPYVWTFDARAKTEVRAVAFDADCLRAKCDADPALGLAVMKRFMPVLVERLHDTRVQMLDLYRARS